MVQTTQQAIMQTRLPLPGRRQGKVRDIYEATVPFGDKQVAAVVIVASDRISAFDVVMPTPIPRKGVVLTQISKFWFDMIHQKLGDQVRHHLISTDPADIPHLTEDQRAELAGRVMIGRKAQVVPIECVVRGYLAGSGWKEYQQSQTVCGIKLPAGLRQCDKLPEPIFTPATKEQTGHDQNISFERGCELVGRELMTQLRDLSLKIYQLGHDYAARRGIILADTKFEFGTVTGEDHLILVDEVLTPDSSRFWPADQYQPGHDQPSFDKQYLRNYLEELVAAGQWDKNPPAPQLPPHIVNNTLQKYLDAYRLLTGRTL